MDEAYLRAHPEHLPTFLTHQRIRETPVSGGSVSTARRLTLDDGMSLFAKTWPSGDPPEDFYAAEAAGLRWLREAGTVPVPQVYAALPGLIATEWVEPGEPTRAAAEGFGRDLAGLHRAGADAFGAPWTGFIGPLPRDNTLTTGSWDDWFVSRRITPYLKLSVDSGALGATEVKLVERLLNQRPYAPAEPIARTHGDLWPGNVHWAADGRAWLIDPAAQGGHRETDLAELALFGGVPHLDVIIDAYAEAHPLADGWRGRVPLHQLHLSLVHTAAFGGAYRDAVRVAASAALRSM